MPALSARTRSSSANASRRPRPRSLDELTGGGGGAEGPSSPSAVPQTARGPRPALALGDFPEIRQAVVALPEAETTGVVAEGSVVEDPTTAALRLLKESFAPFVIVRAHSTVFVVHVRLGEGAWSVVFQVEDRLQEKHYALKVIPLWLPRNDAILGTAALLRRLRHRHIVHCFEHFQYVTHGVPFLCLKLQPCLRGSLGGLLRRGRGRISGTLIVTYITQLASALQYLHQQGILHGDVRADHVLLATHDEEVRLTGLTHSLGLRRRAPGHLVTLTGGHRLYAPPEWAESPFPGRALLPTETPLPSYDMWGLGCLLVELCTHNLLEDRLGLNSSPLATDAAALEAVLHEMEAVHRGAFARLGHGLLDRDPETRMTAQQVPPAMRATAAKVGFWSGVMAKMSRQS
eukprot:EG_transcript_9169